ncbi:PREDICTED: uncharacterized protein LOC109487340, partial [Branchiostoma belcheri]|uniref:Uncharacterized protein LOC109487340 n=1 Tax=Branchiostoma belcheri TaxID=7741 RepID=A0A6P5A0M4_BRABE
MAVAIRGYPFHELSAEKLAKLERSEVDTLALIDAQIVDVKNNTFSDFPRLRRLSLDSNRLTNVKRAWFTGLEPLLVLILANNSIKQIEPGTFMDLTNLSLLDLDNNMLQVLTTLDLRDNDLSSLDKEVLWGQSSLSQLHVSSSRLSSVHGAMPHQIVWRLDRRVQERSSSGLLWFTSEVEAAATVVVEVPKFHFCARDKAYSHELSFGWMFDPSRIEVGNNDMSARNIKPGISCGDLDSSLSTISIQSPSVVLASDGSRSLTDQLDTNAPEQCRQVWESEGGRKIQDDVISGIVRSASLPACTLRFTPDDAVSCRSLPAVLESIKHTYSQIPDHIAAAQRPLPALPRTSWEIQNHELQASAQRPLHVLTHHYSQIPDHIAAAQRPLPALPRTFWEIQNHELQASAQRPLHVLTHNYSEIPDDKDSGPMPLYLDVAEFSLHAVPSSQQNRRSGRSIVTYGSIGHTNAQQNIFYRNASQVKSIMSRRRQLRSLVSQPTDQVAMTYVNVTDARLSRGQDDKRAHITYFSLPNIYWPWEIPGEGTRNTARRASLPTVTLPNTYRPWEIPGEGTRNTPRRASLPTVTLPNTYWQWEIPGEKTRNIARHASLPTVTPPNTYWPWEIPGEGIRNTPRRASLPTVTLPNTYWPWEIPGEGTRNTARRASLPTVTLPNTYWPWEIPREGTRN